jgi:predicted anti-sigma-YlaC factor YlaD
MTCERNRSELREVALGAAPSTRLEAHLASCLACRALLAEERSRLAVIEDEVGQALAVEPSPSLLPRAREVATRQAAEPRSRFAWLLPVAASLIALAVLIPLAERISPSSGSRQASLPPLVTAPKPRVSAVERFPEDMEPPTADAGALTLGD